MSCDHHRKAYFRQLGLDGGVISDTFGTAREIETVLEKIYNTACSQAARGDPHQVRQAEAATQALFDQMAAAGCDMRHLHHTALPSHKNSWFGYAAVYHTLDAVRNRRPLPALASAILAHRQHTRRLSAVGKDAHGYHRCASCGRFTSPVRSHLCPITASPEMLNRALMRRLGVSASAYSHGLGPLINDARNGDGTLLLKHTLTGEIVEVTLDSLPLALATGFTPEAWKGQTTAVELADGRIVSVLDATGLTQIGSPTSAVGAAGVAYGISIPDGAPVATAAGLPSVSSRCTHRAVHTNLQDGQSYDPGHFISNGNRKVIDRTRDLDAITSSANSTVNAQDVTELRQAMSKMAQAVEILAKAQGKVPVAPVEPSAGERR